MVGFYFPLSDFLILNLERNLYWCLPCKNVLYMHIIYAYIYIYARRKDCSKNYTSVIVRSMLCVMRHLRGSMWKSPGSHFGVESITLDCVLLYGELNCSVVVSFSADEGLCTFIYHCSVSSCDFLLYIYISYNYVCI